MHQHGNRAVNSNYLRHFCDINSAKREREKVFSYVAAGA